MPKTPVYNICTRLPQVLLLVEKTTPTSAVQAARHLLKPELVRSPKLALPAAAPLFVITLGRFSRASTFFRSRLRFPTRKRSVPCEHQPWGYCVRPHWRLLRFLSVPAICRPDRGGTCTDLSFARTGIPAGRPNRSTEAERSLHPCAHV